KHNRPSDHSAIARLIATKTARMQELIRTGQAAALPGVDEFVRGLGSYPLAICSGALRREIEQMLDGIGLREVFPIVVAAEDVAIGKPDPSGYLLATRLLAERWKRALTPADVLVIEDAPTVMESARAVGFKTLGVATTYPISELSNADYAVASLRPAEVR